MAEALGKAVLDKFASFAVDRPADYIIEEIKAAKSAREDLKQMHDNMEAICAVLQDAEDKAYSNERIKIWLQDLKKDFYDIDDLLDEVAYHAKRLKANKGHFTRLFRYFASFLTSITSRFHWSHKIKDLRANLDSTVAKKDQFNLSEHPADHSSRDDVRDPLDRCAFVRDSSIIGRDKAKLDVLDKISAVGDATELSVLPIVGMGGIGKTALAKLVYDYYVCHFHLKTALAKLGYDYFVCHFHLKLWVCVSDKFQIRQIIEDIVKDGGGDVTPNQDLNTLVKKLRGLLHDKKYLLVLDDVWVEDVAMWKKLKDLLDIGKAGSVVLITTRKENVASITQANMEPYYLDKLPEDACWLIFKGLAFSQGEEVGCPGLCEIGKAIIGKCCGIPLVAITLGSLLRNVRDEEEWKRINEMDGFVELHEHQQYVRVKQLLKLSYDKLPRHLKPCFAHLSIFQKNENLSTNNVPNLWSALGLLQVREKNRKIEDVGHSYFMELVTRSLLEGDEIRLDNIECQGKMHDLLHDLAMDILGKELSVTTLDMLSVSKFTRHIVWGYEEEGSLKDKEFPKELLKARNARTFRFGYKMGHISRSFLEGIISHCSCLRILDLGNSWFEELPASIGNLIHLRYLDLSDNPIIRTLPNTMCKLLNLEVLDVDNCVALKEIPKGVLQLQSLRYFTVTTCQRILLDNKLDKLSCLHSLSFWSCERLEYLWGSSYAGGLTSLRIMLIDNCPNLRYLPESMKFLSSLEVLSIQHCEELDMGKRECLQGLQSLRFLVINELPKLKMIPDGIQSASSSLTELVLQNCGGLVELPDCLQQFASLQSLVIEGCPHLTERCAEFIPHIPQIMLNGAVLKSN